MPYSSRTSIDSATHSQWSGDDVAIEKIDSRNNPCQPVYKVQHSNTLLSRTSTILEAIKDENELTRKETQNRIEPIPFDDGIEAGSEEGQVARDLEGNPENTSDEIEDKDDGEFNKIDIIDQPPDGTFWGWTAAFCALSANCFSWGVNSVYGVFLNYYVESNHFPGASMTEYALIGGLSLGISFMLCNLANMLVRRYGLKVVMGSGVALQFLCFWLASIATTITQLIIFQGFLMAIGFALVACPAFIILPTWFLKKRSIASGISTAGAGLAGIVFARPSQAIIDGKGGYKWALRMIGLVSGFMLLITTILMRPRTSLKAAVKIPLWKEIWVCANRFDLFKQRPILCLVAWNAIYGLSYAILLYSFSSYATAIGLTSEQGSIVTTVQSVAQCVGRPFLGYISDKCGRANTTILITYFIGLITLVFWVFITTYPALIVFGFIVGTVMGVNWVNFTPLTSDIVGGSGPDLLSATFLITFTGGVPLIPAEIIALKLKRNTEDKPYLYCQIFVAIACFVGASALLPFREWKIKRMFTARRRILQNKLAKGETLDLKETKRLERYNRFLKPTLFNYLIRTFYPIKA